MHVLQLASDTVGNAGKWDVNKSWHAQYKDSAYVYVGGLPNDLSEGDIVIIFSQFGEVVDVNIPRDQKTGKPKGFAFIAYEDQRSTVLAVDNFNGAKLLARTLRCDHCASYNEEQKKDADNLPDHLQRKLSERELEQKRKDILRRNEELDEDNAAKASTFAAGRGTHETEAQLEERAIRQQIVQVRGHGLARAPAQCRATWHPGPASRTPEPPLAAQSKDANANSKREQHIAAVLAKRKAESQAAATEEARKQEVWEERKRAKEREALAASSAAHAVPHERPKQSWQQAERSGEGRGEVRGGEAKGGSSRKNETAEDRWERMMNGGSRKKSKKEHKAAAPPTSGSHHERSGSGGSKKMGEDSVSVSAQPSPSTLVRLSMRWSLFFLSQRASLLARLQRRALFPSRTATPAFVETSHSRALDWQIEETNRMRAALGMAPLRT